MKSNIYNLYKIQDGLQYLKYLNSSETGQIEQNNKQIKNVLLDMQERVSSTIRSLEK